MDSLLALIVVSTLTAATPVVLAAVGGSFTAQVNVFNVGLEGLMLTGAFVGFVVSDKTGNVGIALLAAAGAGIVMAILLAVFVLALNADEVVAGLGINLGALGLTSVLAASVYGTQGSVNSSTAQMIPRLDGVMTGVPVIGTVLAGINLMTIVAIPIVIFASVFTFRSKHGLRMRAIGSSPAAAASGGVSLSRYRYLAFGLSGALCGVAGACLPLSGLSLFSANMTAGVGYIALAAVLFGRGRPGLSAAGAYLYGVTFAVSVALQKFNISAELVQMLPWVATIVALAIAVRRTRSRRESLT